MNEEKMKGKVKFFNPRRYFGFIESEGKKDLFFHGSDVLEEKDLEEGDEVEFETEESEKGLQAVKVERVVKEAG